LNDRLLAPFGWVVLSIALAVEAKLGSVIDWMLKQ
jgi:hypothetical protein